MTNTKPNLAEDIAWVMLHWCGKCDISKQLCDACQTQLDEKQVKAEQVLASRCLVEVPELHVSDIAEAQERVFRRWTEGTVEFPTSVMNLAGFRRAVAEYDEWRRQMTNPKPNLAEAITTLVEDLADQQAMADDSWKPELEAILRRLAPRRMVDSDGCRCNARELMGDGQAVQVVPESTKATGEPEISAPARPCRLCGRDSQDLIHFGALSGQESCSGYEPEEGGGNKLCACANGCTASPTTGMCVHCELASDEGMCRGTP